MNTKIAFFLYSFVELRFFSEDVSEEESLKLLLLLNTSNLCNSNLEKYACKSK